MGTFVPNVFKNFYTQKSDKCHMISHFGEQRAEKYMEYALNKDHRMKGNVKKTNMNYSMKNIIHK